MEVFLVFDFWVFFGDHRAVSSRLSELSLRNQEPDDHSYEMYCWSGVVSRSVVGNACAKFVSAGFSVQVSGSERAGRQ